MRNWATSLIAILTAGAALATPPQVVTVTDTLFARTADTLFLLREVTDNHGLHTVLQTDTLLVSRSISGTDDRGFRTVARVVDYGPDMPPEERVVVMAPTAPINPYDVFTDFGAWPITAGQRALPDDLRYDINGLSFSGYGYGGEARFYLALADVSLRIEDTLQATRAVAPLRRVGAGTTGPDVFDPAAYHPLASCDVTAVQMLYDFPDDPALAQITCGDEDELQSVALWLVVPRASN